MRTVGLHNLLARYASKRFVFLLAIAYLIVFVVWARVDSSIEETMGGLVDKGVLVKEVIWYRVYLASWCAISLCVLGAGHAVSMGLQNFRKGESHITEGTSDVQTTTNP